MKVYLIPGLGYDCRIFRRLNFGEVDPICINWIEPKRREPFRDYTKRLFAQVKESEQVVLIGHSLGAIAAQEIAQVKKINKIILLSSIKGRAEMPFFFKLMSPSRLYKLFTVEFSIWSIPYWGSAHGFANVEDQDLFKSMVGKQSNHYLQWALRALSAWQSSPLPSHTQLVQIHGTDDKTFPLQNVKNADVVIPEGSHIMVYNQAEKISKILRAEIGRMKGPSSD